MIKRFDKWTFEMITSMISLLVGCVAIYLTYSSLQLQREHNFKTVKPISNFRFSNYEDEIGLYIENKGVGPMIIRSLRVYKMNNAPAYKVNVVDWMPQLPAGMYWSDFRKQMNRSVIAPNESRALIELKGDMHDSRFVQFKESVKRELQTLVVELIYTDIYDNVMPVSRVSVGKNKL